VVSPEDVMQLLRGVVDPELGSDIVDLGMAKGVKVDGGVVTVTIALTTAGCPLKGQIQKDIRNRLATTPGVDRVDLDWTEMTAEEKSACMDKARWNAAQRAGETEIPLTTKVLAVSSGKGGVGREPPTLARSCRSSCRSAAGS
jgi:ATP-binding protein involved in chromosome partitioning